ncbi:AbrB/MazE/SpoVT family DNA-binding domain-containing protein [Anaerotignum sp.]|uniref:AbrB/MazE/SpoVT family DNA-binding domain-containing protein n=1 Tax=Anaerotignum sp. TaxID=2039241 RepID=UPI00289F41B0|nr:AbrB/MazE/SpoVT family DNA-binding domain-containing protein [Anaerotignum sp.]
MKATGITRKVDELGRIVLPMEIRRNKGINFGDPMEIFTTEDGIVLRRFEAVKCDISEKEKLFEK